MFFSTDMCGNSAYDWNIRLIGRRSGGSAHRSTSGRPSSAGMVIVPVSGCSKPAMLRSRVVLPHPLGPSSAKNSFGRMSMLTSSTASVSPKRLDRPRMESRAGRSSVIGHP